MTALQSEEESMLGSHNFNVGEIIRTGVTSGVREFFVPWTMMFKLFK